MTTLDDIVRVYRIERLELTAWIEQRWVRPRTTPDGLVFDEVDEARIALIRELRQELMVNDEALPLVLSLLDQVYAARQLLRTVDDAIAHLPEPVRQQVKARLRPSRPEDGTTAAD